MIKLTNFLLLINNISNYCKKDIDKGKTPPEIYKICSCIRETFCLSYSIRKNNDLYIYFQEERVLIKFEGIKLRYLGPDERSQALLLNKAINKSVQIESTENDNWIKSTPGIFCKKFQDNKSFLNNFKLTIRGKPAFICNSKENKSHTKPIEFDSLDDINDLFYIIPASAILTKALNFIQLFNELKNIKFVSLSKIKAIENKILYINFQIDKLETKESNL